MDVGKVINPSSYPILLSANSIMELTGIKRSMVYNLLNRSDLPVVRINGRKYMNRDRFIEWLDQQHLEV